MLSAVMYLCKRLELQADDRIYAKDESLLNLFETRQTHRWTVAVTFFYTSIKLMRAGDVKDWQETLKAWWLKQQRVGLRARVPVSRRHQSAGEDVWRAFCETGNPSDPQPAATCCNTRYYSETFYFWLLFKCASDSGRVLWTWELNIHCRLLRGVQCPSGISRIR